MNLAHWLAAKARTRPCHTSIALAVLVLLLLGALPARVEAGSRRADETVVHAFDLSRDPKETLHLLWRLGKGVWQYGDDRRVGRIESEASYSTSFQYQKDPEGTGWHAQAFLAIHDLQADDARPAGKKPVSKKAAPEAFVRYLLDLPQMYIDAGYGVAVSPAAAKLEKHLKAKGKKVPVFFADMGVTWKHAGGREEEYHVDIYGFLVRDFLVTVRVHFITEDVSRMFLDGLSLSTRRRIPADVFEAKFTSITTDQRETRLSLSLPKGYRRVHPGAPDAQTHGVLARYRLKTDGDVAGEIRIDRHHSSFAADRDARGWKERVRPMLGAEPEFREDRKHKALQLVVGAGSGLRGQKPVVLRLAFLRVGGHRYSIRLEIPAGVDKAERRADKEMRALLKDLQGWVTQAR